MKNILHISDIHVSDIPTAGMNENMLQSLRSALIQDFSLLPQIDTIFITGDIANSGKTTEYEIFMQHFLSPLLSDLKLDSSRVFITPGNHDVNRKDWKASDQIIRSGLISNPEQSSVEGILREKIDDQNYTWSPNFTNLRNQVDLQKNKPIISNKFFAAYEIEGIGIGCINSAWLAHEKDEKSLFVGEWQFLEVIKALKPYSQKIILMHHPLDWLHPADKLMFTNHLHSSKINCLFFGHMHEFWMTKESIFSEDTVLKLQAGRFDKSKNPELCGYSLISLHEKNTLESGEIYFRKFDSKKNAFAAWTERVNEGRVSFSLTNSLPFDPERFCSCCTDIISGIEFDLLCNTGLPSDQRKKLSEIFILPTLANENEEGIPEDTFDSVSKAGKLDQFNSLNSLANSIDSLVILGGENSGKTTLAKRLALYYLLNQSTQNLQHVVYYLDAKGRALNNVKRINRELLDFYCQEGNEAVFLAKIESKLNSSSAVIILDSIECLSPQSLKVVFEYISKSPARFIIFGQLSARPALKELTQKLSNCRKFIYLNLRSLKRSHLKELVRKWKPNTSSNQTSKVANGALKVVSGAGMANNPFVYTMLLSIHERKTGVYRTYMHEADLIENFIEIIMQKHVLLTGNVPQYKDLLLFLGFVAIGMYQNDSYIITENDLLKKALDFNKIITQEFNARDYFDPVLGSGILKKIGENQYRFAQICFF